MSMGLSEKNHITPELVLSKALLRAGIALKLNQSDLAKIMEKIELP